MITIYRLNGTQFCCYYFFCAGHQTEWNFGRLSNIYQDDNLTDIIKYNVNYYCIIKTSDIREIPTIGVYNKWYKIILGSYKKLHSKHYNEQTYIIGIQQKNVFLIYIKLKKILNCNLIELWFISTSSLLSLIFNC